MKNIKLILIATIAVFTLNSCEEDTLVPLDTNYVTFAETAYTLGVDPGGSATLDVNVFAANITSETRVLELSVDSSGAAAGSFSAPTTVSIPGGTNKGMMSITLTDTDLGIGINSLIIDFTAKSNLSKGDPTVVSYIQNCSEVTATLQINFDGYASETSWVITDSLGGVVMEAALGKYADGLATVTETITLCAGRDFTLEILDAYGDGLTYPSQGSYSLTVGTKVVIDKSGDFGDGESTEFDTK
jgi:hypothetical protein